MSSEVSKSIRQELKKTFPKIKFSVVTPHYGSVRVRWIDGVKSETIEKLTGKYEYGHFDGMTDCYEYSNSRSDIPQCKFVFCNRDYSVSAIEHAIDAVKTEYGINGEVVATPEMYNNGELHRIYTCDNARNDPYWSLQSQISQWLANHDFF